jgi:hypothetical protein
MMNMAVHPIQPKFLALHRVTVADAESRTTLKVLLD